LTFNVIMAFLAAENRRVRYAAEAMSGEMPSARGAHPEPSFQRRPWRLVAEPCAQIVQQGRNLRVGHAGGKSGHDRAAFAFDGLDAGQHDIGEITRIGAGDRGTERQIDPTIRQWPSARVA
jgi:hypothetical protein